MSDDEILRRIEQVAREHLRFEGSLSLDSPLVATLALDSLRMLTFVAELENAFRIILEEGDERGLVTVGDLVALLRRNSLVQ